MSVDDVAWNMPIEDDKVEPGESKRLEESSPGENDPSFEYNADCKDVILLAPAILIHQKVEIAIST